MVGRIQSQTIEGTYLLCQNSLAESYNDIQQVASAMDLNVCEIAFLQQAGHFANAALSSSL
jgi:hypothetical protein